MKPSDESNDYIPHWIDEVTPESSARDALVESYRKDYEEQAKAQSQPAPVNQSQNTSESPVE